ncbi:MAG: Ig-like domain-containing protein, partial [Planctomycetota bacterium]
MDQPGEAATGMFSYRHSVIALTAILCACGSQGAGSSNSNTGLASYGAIALTSHTPSDAAVQVPLDTTITLRFDAFMVLDCTRHPDTWLRRAGTEISQPGTWSLGDNGRALVFTPSAPLAAETDYDVSVSPLTCDREGRILETATTFSFRTLDETPPSVVSANVAPNQTGISRTAPFVVTLSEAFASSSVTANTVILRDVYNQRYDCERTVQGSTLSVQPLADLPGDRRFTLQLSNTVTDRAGNGLPATWTVSFFTANDASAPSVTSVWPPNQSTGVSPLVQPIVTFDEGMDPFTVEPSSLLFQDEFGSLVAYTVVTSTDQRTLRVRPNQPLSSGRTYLLAFLISGAAVTDVSGNPLSSTQPLSFVTSSDAIAPQLTTADPANLATRTSLNAEPRVTFAESLDPAFVTTDTVQLLQNGDVVPVVLSRPDAQSVLLSPVLPLLPATSYTVRLASGHDGLRDLAGNVMPQDLHVVFATAEDATLPTASMQPSDGAVGLPPSMHASIVFNSKLDPTTVSDSTCELRTDAGQSVPCIVELTSNDRVVTVTPLQGLTPLAYYRAFVRGGPSGVREESGNWLESDLNARFRIGSTPDYTAPVVTATVNGIDTSRRNGLVLPTHGFSFDIDVTDGIQAPDLGSVRIDLVG